MYLCMQMLRELTVNPKLSISKFSYINANFHNLYPLSGDLVVFFTIFIYDCFHYFGIDYSCILMTYVLSFND